MVKKVCVLLSAYNGERYLQDQLDSILSQQGVEVSLLVRDDGSTDRTAEILDAYAHRFACISVYAGENKGAAGSFYDLLARADMGADYYAFADQDDVWHVDKLAQAVRRLEHGPCGQPLLYAGKVICASKDLAHREVFSYRIGREPSFGNALMENICMGCTEVFNRSLLLLVRGHLPQGDIMHDWWLYLTAAYFGKVVYDQNAYMLYRQHENNAVGMRNHWGMRWKIRVMRLGQMKHKLSSQAAVFRKAYAQLPAASWADTCRLQLLCVYRGSLYRRICLAADRGIYRQDRLDDLACRLLAVIGYL